MTNYTTAAQERAATEDGIIVAGDDAEILDDEDDEENETTETHRAVLPYDHEPRGFWTDENYDDNYSRDEGRE